MKLHDLNTDEDLNTVAFRMWDIVHQHYPELTVVMAKVVADERLERIDLIRCGFQFGAAFALSEMVKGHIQPISDESYQNQRNPGAS